jgi:CspA family cold shock protein
MNGGTLKFLCARRGYGFIVPDDAGPEVFVHQHAFDQAGLTPQAGMRLAFRRHTTREGKVKAADLRPEAALA